MKYEVGKTYTLTGDETSYLGSTLRYFYADTQLDFPVEVVFEQTDFEGDLQFVTVDNRSIYVRDDSATDTETAYDVVQKPEHYTKGMPDGVEVIDVIRSQGWESNFYLANAAKYLLRCEHKGNKRQDLEKMMQFVRWELDRLDG